MFARLWIRDGKPSYLGLIPRVWGHVTHNLERLEDPRLTDLIRSALPEPSDEHLAKIKGARA